MWNKTYLTLFVLMMFAVGCWQSSSIDDQEPSLARATAPASGNPPTPGSPPPQAKIGVLLEAELADLLQGKLDEKNFEASGVVFAKEKIYVVFDNSGQVAQIAHDLHEASVLGEKVKKVGYEGFAYDDTDGAFYLVEESLKHQGEFNAVLHRAADATFPKTEDSWLDFALPSDNKGFEGLALVVRDSQRFLLALCEGNQCAAGKAADISGQGRIQVFAQQDAKWMHIATISLPPSVDFIDYSGMDINDNNVLAITSQESSALWVGSLAPATWAITGSGTVYPLPVGDDGRMVYCNIEGVTWVTQNQLVLVSDAKKKEQPKRCAEKAESVHLIEISQ